VLNSVFNFVQFWDGRAKDLADQAAGPIQNPVEMASSKTKVVDTLKHIPGYAPMFQSAFPEDKDPITFDNVTQAIAAYEATLITPNAPFDRYLKGDANALNADQKAGLQLFINDGCAACHNGVGVGGAMYAKFGVVSDPDPQLRPASDKGREDITKSPADEYVYKVPSLRNITLTGPYFHTGKVSDLHQAVAIMGKVQLGQTLPPADIDKIVDFLGSLTGDQPKVVYPSLPPSTPDTPKPPYP
jgi:cytochrome c peroxidase